MADARKQGKQEYSLISVDVAPEREEVLRVDAHGVHQVDVEPARAAETPQVAAAPKREAGTAQSRSVKAAAKDAPRTDDEPSREDLEGPVPMATMQRVIIVALVVVLAAFIAYSVLGG